MRTGGVLVHFLVSHSSTSTSLFIIGAPEWGEDTLLDVRSFFILSCKKGELKKLFSCISSSISLNSQYIELKAIILLLNSNQ